LSIKLALNFLSGFNSMNTQKILFYGAIALLSVATASAQTVIKSVPHTIKKSGTYILDKNLVYSGHAKAIDIEAADVTIDLQGFTLSCSDDISPTIGVYVDNFSDVTVKNGVITGFRTGVDIDSPSAQNLQNVAEIVQDLQITAPQYGIVILNPTLCLVQRNTIMGGQNGAAISLTQSIGANRVSYNQVTGAQYGFQTDGYCYLLENMASACLDGFFAVSTDKYRFCTTVNCTTPFNGGTDAGDAND
jgi:Periplasmic copper-binding protein (NosD)